MIDMYFLIYKTKKQLYYYSFFACNCSNACNKVSTEYTAYTYLTSLKQQLGGLMNVRRITTKKVTHQNKLPKTGIAKQKLLIEPALHLSHATQATSNRYNQSHHGKDAL